MSDSTSKRPVSKGTLIGLLVVFLAPLVLATLLYQFRDRLPTIGTRSHGELIDPARPWDRFEARTADARRLTLDDLRGKWTLAYLGAGPCDLACEAGLFKMRQVRLALGTDMKRVQRLYLGITPQDREGLQPIQERDPRLIFATLGDGARHALGGVLGEDAAGHIYVIDPLGNVMMRYDARATSKGMLKDLRHLLKVSQIG
jgi:cytochrome oxidase Cu insertion factor (SCO1/SenC/PrrC family)